MEETENEFQEQDAEVEKPRGVDLVKVMAVGFVIFVYFVIFLKILFIP